METSAESFSESEENAAAAAVLHSSQTWAMLIKRVYEVDPLSCPQCGGQMEVVGFIEPLQGKVIEKILKHCGLWQTSCPRAPPDVEELVLELDASYSDSPIGFPDQTDQPQELTYVDIDTFLSTF